MWSLAELTAELSTACFAGTLMLQAMGLGGWMFDGMDPLAVLGASGDSQAPGLGFHYDTNELWPLPNPTGLPGIFEGHTPPYYGDRFTVKSLRSPSLFKPNIWTGNSTITSSKRERTCRAIEII